jgi:hypothetical protein
VASSWCLLFPLGGLLRFIHHLTCSRTGLELEHSQHGFLNNVFRLAARIKIEPYFLFSGSSEKESLPDDCAFFNTFIT